MGTGRFHALLLGVFAAAASLQQPSYALTPPPGAQRQDAGEPGTLLGLVLAAADSQPVAAARLRIAGRLGELRSDALGRFRLELAAGTHTLTVTALGYAPETVEDLRIAAGETVTMTVFMEPAPIRLDEIVVSPSTYGILRDVTPGVQTLTREEVQTQPHFGEDIYRAVNRLPGLTAHDIKIKLRIRGSPDDQVLQTLDGIELYEPFHLKDVDGALSIIDVESVSGIDLRTGGFSAEYGDKLAGVFAMETTTPRPDEVTTTLGASFMNLTFKNEGGFAGGRGTWLASARRGYLDIILGLMGSESEIKPTYYDAFTKIQYQLGPKHVMAGHVLYAGDRWSGVDDDDWTEVHSSWSTGYAWVTWRAAFTDALTATTLLSASRLTRDRDAADYFGQRDADANRGMQETDVEDRGSFDAFGLKQDWSFLASDRLLVRWGVDLKRGVADYDYHRWHRRYVPNTTDPAGPNYELVTDTMALVAHPTGYEAGVYLSNRVRLSPSLTAEVGARYDHQSHTGDNTVAPRVNAAWQVASGTTLRGAWGWYYQSHGLHEMFVADGDSRFYPSQRAEHRVLGLEQRLGANVTMRLEAYERVVGDPRPEYRDLVPELEQVPEEGPDDRVRVAPTRSVARGLELLITDDAADPVAWSASYAVAAAEDEIDGAWVPRPFEQRHTVRLEFSYRPNPSWSASWAWQYHSGWPTTDINFETFPLATGNVGIRQSYGPMNGRRLPPYYRLDARVSRTFNVGRGRLAVFLDVFNLLGRENAESFDYLVRVENNQLRVLESTSNMLGTLPTLGARWEF